MLTLLLPALLLFSPQADADRKGLPLQVPAGWEGKKQDGAFVLTPKDLAEGKIYTVVIPDLTKKVGSLKGLLEAAKASIGEAGTFKPAHDPAASRNDAGWDYELLIGILEKDGNSVMAQAVALRKGEEEGIVLLLSDSVATMEKYSDAFAAMIRGIGAPKAPPAAAGKVDLKYTTPEGWATQELEGARLLTLKEDQADYRILILPSEGLQGTLRKTFLDAWAVQIKPILETTIVPLPLVRRMDSGMAVAFDQDPQAKNKMGITLNGGLYILARGNRYVPILGIFIGFGNPKNVDKALGVLFESAEIPGAGTEKVALVDPADLIGNWSKSSYSAAHYVSASGAYAGDASIATGAGVILNKDETGKYILVAITRDLRIKEVTEGKWKVEDNELVFRGKDANAKGSSYRIFGVGSDEKGGAFLVLSTYSNQDDKVEMAWPRRSYNGDWFKRDK